MEKEKNDEVFVDAEEEITPRRTGRKRRSTAGAPAVPKKSRSGKNMALGRSPDRAQPRADATSATPAAPPAAAAAAAAAVPPDQIVVQMQALLSGMEGRLNKATVDLQQSVTGQIGDLKERVIRNEERMDSLMTDVDNKIEEKLKKYCTSISQQDGEEWALSVGSQSEPSSYASALSRVPSQPSVSAPLRGESRRVDPVMTRDEEDYWACRKALRLRPLGEGDEHETVKKFMRDYLKLDDAAIERLGRFEACLLYTSPSPRDRQKSRMPSSA